METTKYIERYAQAIVSELNGNWDLNKAKELQEVLSDLFKNNDKQQLINQEKDVVVGPKYRTTSVKHMSYAVDRVIEWLKESPERFIEITPDHLGMDPQQFIIFANHINSCSYKKRKYPGVVIRYRSTPHGAKFYAQGDLNG